MARKALLLAAFVVLVVAVGTAIALPEYSCRDGWHTIPAAVVRGHPTARNTPDVACARGVGTIGVVAGYYPDSRMPLKVAIGVGGAASATVLALLAVRPRRREAR